MFKNAPKPEKLSFIDRYIKLNQTRHKRILVVDDEEFCISTMQIMLTMAGLDTENQVDFCISGQEAIDSVTRAYDNGLTYRLILTDFSMPVMDGLQATRLIRDHLNRLGIPRGAQPTIVGITGHVLDVFTDQGLEAGMD